MCDIMGTHKANIAIINDNVLSMGKCFWWWIVLMSILVIYEREMSR